MNSEQIRSRVFFCQFVVPIRFESRMKDSENFWQNLLMSENKEVYGITQQRDCLCFFVNTDENTEEQGQKKQ